MSKGKQKYSEQDIDVLKGLEPVQHRPGMYTRTDNPNHIIQEVIDNAQDEALAGFASAISVELHEDGSVTVEDNGRGIPVGKHPTEGKPVIEVVFTILHAGGKFRKGEGQTYGFTGGLHGVGVSVTNALSDRLEVTVFRDGYEHNLVFSNGAVIEPLSKKKLAADQKEKTGTRVRAYPNPKYFDSPSISASELERYLRSKAVLLKGATVTWQRPGRPAQVWSFPEGLSQYLQEQMQGETELVAPIFTTEQHYTEATGGFDKGEGFELALAWAYDHRPVRESYVNLIPTPEGGRHETGLKAGLLDAFRAVADRAGAVPKGIKIEADDVWSSMSFVLSVKLLDPQFQNQTKDRMTSEKGHRLVSGLLRDAMELWLNDHPQHAKALIEMVIQSAVARSRQGQKTERKRSVGASVLPGKLSDCESKDVKEAELFLVEGDSAGGCFFPFEIIHLANNERLTIKEIADQQEQGKRHFGYTLDENQNVRIEEFVNARLTKHSAEVVRVVLDNGESSVCTPDHLFMLRDGTYARADALTPGTSLMPLYMKITEKNKTSSRSMFGYHQVMNPGTGRWRYAHILADDWNLAHGVYEKPADIYHRHHVDFKKLNNDPRNILAMTVQDHLAVHMSAIAEYGLHSPEVKARAAESKKDPAFRAKQSARMKRPETRKILSEQAIAQWQDPSYKEFMVSAWKKHYESNDAYRQMNNEQLYKAQQDYWASQEHREAQARRVKEFFENNPEHRERHSQMSIDQWNNEELLAWRSDKTKEQWTPEFRAQRKIAMDENYRSRTLSVMRDCWETNNEFSKEDYDRARKAKGDRYALKWEKALDRFFGGDEQALREAVKHYNHKVVRVEKLTERYDVYDLEVPGTHNFALASGVFVHNSSKQGRDRTKQAILPLRGKLLNTWDVDSHKAMASETIHDIAAAIGVDPHSLEKANQADLSKLRYGKIFIMADADVDGQHIQVLLLTLFLRHFPALILKGHIWIAQAPLYRIDAPAKKGSKTGPRKFYALDENELQSVIKQLEKEGLTEQQRSVTRFKGLGEMNAEQLGETTMNPDNRRSIKITIADAEKATLAFDRMMSTKNAKARRDWMEQDGASIDVD